MRSYRLVFEDTDEARERFSLLYQGFINGGNQGGKTADVIRREGRILDKLEGVSELHEGRACDSCGQLVNGRQQPPIGEVTTIVFDAPEMSMVRKYVEQTPWTTRMSRKVTNLMDWLEGIPQEGG